MKRYDDGTIYDLEPNEYIVIGTNIHGNHSGGAARYAAEHFGLEPGVGVGMSGQCYALPTMEGWDNLGDAVAHFIQHAENTPEHTYYLTRVGCGIAGYKDSEIAPLFADVPSNVIRPEGWGILTNKDGGDK